MGGGVLAALPHRHSCGGQVGAHHNHGRGNPARIVSQSFSLLSICVGDGMQSSEWPTTAASIGASMLATMQDVDGDLVTSAIVHRRDQCPDALND